MATDYRPMFEFLTPIKSKVGRPSGYKPEFDAIAYDTYAEGGFDVTVCATLGCSKNTLKAWRAENESFDEACQTGRLASESLWASYVAKNLMSENGRSLNTAATQLLLRNTFGWLQRDPIVEKTPEQLAADAAAQAIAMKAAMSNDQDLQSIVEMAKKNREAKGD